MKPISSQLHGIIDYLVVVFLGMSPTLFGMPHTVAMCTYGLGLIHLILTLITDFGSGMFKLIPFPVHGTIELIVGIALPILAFILFKDDTTAKIFYTVVGIAVLVVYRLTDYKAPAK